MKFTAIDLLAFGHFSRRSLEFPADGPNLHLVYGPNEAGKSTLLRAITGFLYGFDARPVDAHRFEASELRVGARVRHSSGRERYFTRRKTQGGTLLDVDGRPVDDAQLSDLLSVRERKLFEGMFGLNHEQLRAAGEALASSKQAVAEALFSAALEGSALRNTLARLQDESEALLSTAGRAGEIFKAMKGWDELREAERNAEGSIGKWKRLQEDLSQARAATQALDGEIRKSHVVKGRLERVARTLPWLRRRADAIAQRAALGPVHLLDPGMAQRRRDLLRERDDAELALGSLRQRLDKARLERDQLVVPEALAAMVPSLQAFNERLGAYRKAAADKPALIHEILPYRREAEEILRDLGVPDLPIDEVETLRIPVAERELIQSLQTEHSRLVGALELSRPRLAALEAECEQGRARVDGATAPRDVAVLREVWQRYEADHDLDRLIREVHGRRADLAEVAARRAASLGMPSADLDALLALRVPSEESILAADRGIERGRRDRESLDGQRQAAVGNVATARRELSDLVSAGPVPSPEAVVTTREERDRLWVELRRACLGVGRIPGGTEEDQPAIAHRMDSFAAKMHEADVLADALREQATRVAQHVELLRRCHDAEEAARGVDRAFHALEAAQAERLVAWKASWLDVGLDPGTPQQMLGWRSQWSALAEDGERLRATESECARLATHAAEVHRAVSTALDRAGVATAPDLPWPTLRAIVERTLAEASEASRAHADATARLAELERDLARVRAQHADLETALAAWGHRWEAATARLAGPERPSPEAATAILDRLPKLFEAAKNRARLEKRISAIEKDIGYFETTLVDSLRAGGVSFSGTTMDRAEGYRAAVAQAQQDIVGRRTLDQEVDRLTLEGIGQEERRDRAIAGLRRLFEEAACESVEALEEAEGRSDAARSWDAKRAEAENRLAELGEGWSLGELEEAAMGQDSDLIRGALEALQTDLDTKEHQRQTATLNLGEMRAREAAFGAGDEAARRLQEKHAQAEKARSLAGRYARLQVATSLIRHAMARYQEESQGAVLKRAEALFMKLTRGRYEKLRVEFESEGATIRCVRGGEAVQVKERVMSDGTLDQLYLALRLASIEQHLTLQEPMPLVLDDIFINFDDGRAEAGIEVLAEFAEKTQVLLLTHHGRNLELARRVLRPGTWSEVQLVQARDSGDS